MTVSRFSYIFLCRKYSATITKNTEKQNVFTIHLFEINAFERFTRLGLSITRRLCEARKKNYISLSKRHRDTYLDTTGWTVCKPDCPEHRTLTLPFPNACPRPVSIFPRCSRSAAWSVYRPVNTVRNCLTRARGRNRLVAAHAFWWRTNTIVAVARDIRLLWHRNRERNWRDSNWKTFCVFGSNNV